MAGQLSADDRLRRLRRVGLGVALAALSVLAAMLWLVHRSLSAPQARYVVRPEVSVQGVASGSVVRLNGVVVGRVARVGLWSDPATGRVRPEVVLSLDAAGDPALLHLGQRVTDGLRVQFVTTNPASGFLEAQLVWAPGSAALRATAEPDELPWQPSPRDQTLSAFLPLARRLAADDLRARVGRLVESLGAVESRLAGTPRASAALARNAARLREAVERIEGSDPAGAAGSLQTSLGDAREGLRVVDDALDALDRDLADWPGSASRELREFSSECRAAARRLRDRLPADAAR